MKIKKLKNWNKKIRKHRNWHINCHKWLNLVLNTRYRSWTIKIAKIAYNCKNNQVKKMIHDIKWLLQTNSMFNTFRAELFLLDFSFRPFDVSIDILSLTILLHRQSLVISLYIGVITSCIFFLMEIYSSVLT